MLVAEPRAKCVADFIEKGEYGRSVRTPWQPTSIFQDSTSCLNYADPNRTHSCDECLLMDFVPSEHRADIVPCHHIPLNARGETIDDLEWKEDQRETEEDLKAWLRSTIDKIESRRGETALH